MQSVVIVIGQQFRRSVPKLPSSLQAPPLSALHRFLPEFSSVLFWRWFNSSGEVGSDRRFPPLSSHLSWHKVIAPAGQRHQRAQHHTPMFLTNQSSTFPSLYYYYQQHIIVANHDRELVASSHAISLVTSIHKYTSGQLLLLIISGSSPPPLDPPNNLDSPVLHSAATGHAHMMHSSTYVSAKRLGASR